MADSMNVDKINDEAAATSLIAQGKRHVLVHDYASAVTCIEEACQIFDSIYGVNSDESADAYLHYGSALIELHRQESGALDGLIDAKPSESDAENDEEDDEELEDEEEESKKVTEEKSESNGNKTANEEDISISPTPPTESTAVESTAADNGSISSTTAPTLSSIQNLLSDQNNSNGNTSTTAVAGSTSSLNSSLNTNQMETDVDPNQPSTSTGITNENRAIEDEEDNSPSNLEIAFEVVSMAKNIYKRQTEYLDSAYLKLAEAHQKLGEILYEWENFEVALTDLQECLEIRKKHLPEDDRVIAETYYHIGLTHSFNKNVEEANSNFQKAVNVIEQRITRQKKLYSDTEDPEAKEKIKCDVKELESLLPEMKSKIEDSQDQMNSSTLANSNEQSEKLEEEMIAEKKKQITAKPITNLTHLVKRKREEPESAENSKKLKNGAENGSNGTANTSTNNDIEVDKV